MFLWSCDRGPTFDTCVSEWIALMIVCDMSTSQRHLAGVLFGHTPLGNSSKSVTFWLLFLELFQKFRRIATSWIAWLAALDAVKRDCHIVILRPTFFVWETLNKNRLTGILNWTSSQIKANEAFRERISGAMENGYPLQGLWHYRMKWLDVPAKRRFNPYLSHFSLDVQSDTLVFQVWVYMLHRK